MSDQDWVQREVYNYIYDDRQRLAAIANEAEDVIRDLLDVITGWVGNPELRADPSRYDTTKASGVFRSAGPCGSPNGEVPR